jgi:hypothetical protein
MLEQCFSTFLPQGTQKIIFNIQRNPPSVKMCTGQKSWQQYMSVLFIAFQNFKMFMYSMIFHRTLKWYFAEPSLGSDGLEVWHQVYITVTHSCGVRKIWMDLRIYTVYSGRVGLFSPRLSDRG